MTDRGPERLKAARDAAWRVAVTIWATSRKPSWTSDGFRASFTSAPDAAKIEGRTFHDLRGTAVTRLALAGCTVPEIATITGDDLKTVETILSKHCLGREGQRAWRIGDCEAGKAQSRSVKCKPTCERVWR